MDERWDDVRVTVIRPGPVDQRGPCANSIPQDDFKVSSLPRGKIQRKIVENNKKGNLHLHLHFIAVSVSLFGVSEEG